MLEIKTKFVRCRNGKDGTVSSTSALMYMNFPKDSHGDMEYIRDIESYKTVTVPTFDKIIDKIHRDYQIHNYQSEAYKEEVPKSQTYVIRLEIYLDTIEEIKRLMNEVPIKDKLDGAIFKDLKEVINQIEVIKDCTKVCIAMYMSELFAGAGYLSLADDETRQPIFHIFRISEHTKIDELNLGGFGNTVSGYNSATFEFLPFIIDNYIYIQTPGSGKLSADGFVVSFGRYDYDSELSKGLLELSFKPKDAERFISDKKEFEKFNNTVESFLTNKDNGGDVFSVTLDDVKFYSNFTDVDQLQTNYLKTTICRNTHDDDKNPLPLYFKIFNTDK